MVPRNFNLSKNLKLVRRLSLVLLLVLGFTLRVWNINWDEGTHQHPDERYWSMVTEDIAWPGVANYFDSDDSTLNPYSHRSTWVYGTLPLFLTKATAHYLESDTFLSNAVIDTASKFGIGLKEKTITGSGQVLDSKTFDSGYKANLIGRLLSAIVDTGTTLLVYLLGRELFNRKVGFLSAVLHVFTVLHIQYSHFYGAESWVAFFATLTMLLSVKLFKTIRLSGQSGKLANRRTLWLLLSVGFAFGLTVASKLSGLTVGIVPIISIILCLASRLKSKELAASAKELAKFFGLGTFMLSVAFLAFRLFQPYAFSGIFSFDDRFISDIEYLRSVNSGADVPWVVQWVGVTPLWFPLKSIFWHGMGPALAIAVLVGLCIAGHEIIKERNQILLIPLSFILVMLGLVSQQFNPLIRYLLPAYPVAIIFGGYGIYRLWHSGRDKKFALLRKVSFPQMSRLTAIALVAVSIFWGAAFVNGIYNNSHPRVSATSWINENIDSGSTVTHQIWDDQLPLALANETKAQLNYVDLDLFRSDQSKDPESGNSKLDTLVNNLERTDYIIEASNRLYGSIPRIPAEYPGTTAYYNALFSGELGFELVAEFENSPSLFGINFSDTEGEETFTVYDHPKVTIWSKTDQWSQEEALKILNPFRATFAPNLEPKDANSNALLLKTAERTALQGDDTFYDTFTKRGYLGAPHWVWWLLWLQVAAFAVLPWSTLLFRQFADAGYGLSKVIGFLSTGTLLWVFVVWDVVGFNQTTAFASLLTIFAIGLALWWAHRERLLQLFCKHRFAWLASEVVFLSIFAFLLTLRSLNPDLWDAYLGGEKPMELGYLTAVGKSTELPPYDPWFAGGAMNYYYFGWFLLALPMRALKIVPEVAFQFGVATFGALIGVLIFSLTYNLVMVRHSSKAKHSLQRRTALKVGALGLFLFMGSGTLDALRVHSDRLRSANTWTFLDNWPLFGFLVEVAGGTWAWMTGTSLQRFDWWTSSRVNSGNYDITEFPYFTFLFGDLHPHLMGMAISGLTIAFAFAYLIACQQTLETNKFCLAAGIGLLAGVIRMTNTWDYPTSLLLLFVTFFLGACISISDARPNYNDNKASLFGVTGVAIFLSAVGSGGSTLIYILGVVGILGGISVFFNTKNQNRILQFIGHFSIAIVAHTIFLWPYIRDTKNFNVGIHRAKWTSPLDDFMSHWGIFIAIGFMFFAVISFQSRMESKKYNVTVHFLPNVLRQNVWVKSLVIGVSMTGLAFCFLWVSGAFAITIFGGFCALFLIEHECRNPNPNIGKLFALVMFIFGFAVVGGPEIITVNNDVARMNTVFKFWLQGWLFFALGSAFAIHHIWDFVKSLQKSEESTSSDYRISPKMLWRLFVLAMVAIGLTYPLLATKPRLSTRFDTGYKGLNGVAYLDYEPSIVRNDQGNQEAPTVVRIAEDLPLIEWIRSNVSGNPTIVEWSGDSYDWNSRIAIHTGLPTVLGWSSHQYQQRQKYADWILQRRLDIQNFYTEATQETVTEFLLTYEVGYVIVGVQEHRFGNPDVLNSFSDHPALRKVFESDQNTIYSVENDALWASSPS